MKRWYKTLCEYDVAHPGYGCEGFRWGRKGIAIAALICVLAMMAGCSGVNMALDTPADGFDRIISANGSGYGDNAAGVDDAVDDSADTVTVTPAVDVSNDSDVVVQSVVDDSGNESAVPQVEGDGLTWPEAGFTGETTIIYDANGKGSFADGATTNVVTTRYDSVKEVTKYAHTDNVNDAGEQNGGYGNNKSYSRVVTIPGASSLTVNLTYQTESTSWDWVCAYAGKNIGNVQCSTSLTGKLGGTTKITKSFTVDGDSVTFWFKSDGSGSNYYGYYAVVKGFVGSKKHVSGTYAVPVDPSNKYVVMGWNTKPNGSGENFGVGEVYLPSNQTVYAQWSLGPNYKKWGTIGWCITDDGTLEILPWEGDTGTTGFVSHYTNVPWYYQSSKIKKVESTGNIVLNASSIGLFLDCSNLTDLTSLASWDVSKVTNMSIMFYGCSNLTDLTPLASWNVSNITDMGSVFYGCSNLTDISPLKDWSVSNVKSMVSMFYGCSKLADLSPLASWNVSNVTDMNGMFSGCSNLTDLTALAGWDVSNVTGMYSMFQNCSSLTDLTALAGWDVSNVTSMGAMFSDCSNLTDLTALASWNVSNVTGMYYMFSGCSSLTDLTALADWDVSNVTDMGFMFSDCSSLTALTALAGWDVSNVTGMYSMFQNCSKLADLSVLAGWNVSNVKNMRSMFNGCSNLTNIFALASWNISNVTDMNGMFWNCSNLTDLSPLTSWDVSKVTNISGMFRNCSNLTDLTPLADWDVSNVTEMGFMFSDCSNLTDLTALADWDVSSVWNMYSMFDGCSSLTALTGLSGWNVSNVMAMESVFSDCSSLTDLSPLSNWDVSKVTSMSDMFSNCPNLTDLSPLASWNVSKVTHMSGMFSGCSSLTDLTVLAHWDMSDVRSVYSMFFGCSSLQKIGIPSIANGGQNLVNNASALYLTNYMPTIISEDFTMGPYSWSQLASEMQTNPDAFQEGTIWVKYTPSYIVSYDANGGLATMNRSMVPIADNLTLPQSSFIRFGYQFIGWTTQSDPVSDTNPLMQPSVSWRPNNPQDGSKYTLYAQWKQVGNIGDLPTSSQTGMLPGWIQTNQQGVVGSIKPLETALVSFINTYDPNATSLELSFAKMLDNRIPDRSFVFELYDNENHLLQTVKSVGSTVPFAPLTFSEAGDYVYYVREKAGADQTIAYDDHVIEITVSVTADPDDATKLKATAQIIGDTTFNNTSKPAKLSIEKRVEGTDDVAKTFTFNVSLTDRDNKPVNGSFVTSIGDNGANGGESSSVTFVDGMAQVHVMAGQTLVIHGIDAYAKYQVSENVDQMPAGYELAQITGDTGTLAAAGHSQVVAVNEYKADPAYVTLGAIKRLVDEQHNEVIMDKGEFSFVLCKVDDASLPVEQQSCAGVSDASNDGSGRVAFEQLVFDVPGTYVYRIKEVIGSDAYMQYDKHQVTAMITVTDNGQGKLVASVAYQDINGGAVDMADDSTPVFVNTTLDRGGFAITGSGPWMIAGIIAIALMTLVLAWMVLRRIMRI